MTFLTKKLERYKVFCYNNKRNTPTWGKLVSRGEGKMLHYKAEDHFQSDAMVAIKRICDYKDEEIHNHDFIEIVYIIEGTGMHCINGEEFLVKAGDLLFINHGCTHAFYVNNKLIAYNLMISVDYFTENSSHFGLCFIRGFLYLFVAALYYYAFKPKVGNN